MSEVRCFAPAAQAGARVLVLGSMPGEASLCAGEYYAHPRNAFWPIIMEVFGAAPDLAYSERLRLLTDHGIALWAVPAVPRHRCGPLRRLRRA